MSIVSLQWWQPLALLLLAVWPWLWWQAGRSLAGQSRRRARWSAGVRSALWGALVLALADPRLEVESTAPALLWLVDQSASLPAGAAEAARLAVAETSTQQVPVQRVVDFAGRAQVRPTVASQPSALDSLEPGATDLAQAVQVALAAAPAGHVPHLLVVGDGRMTRQTDTDLRALADGAGAELHWLPVAPPAVAEVLVQRMAVPPTVREGEPFVLEAEVVATVPMAQAVTTLFRDGVQAARQTVDLVAGSNRVRFNLRGGREAATRWTVHVEAPAAEGDRLAANNRLAAVVAGEAPPAILVLTDRTETVRFWAAALRQQGLRVEARPAAGVPRGLAEWLAWDLVVLDNLPAATLLPEAQTELAAWVRDFGGGLLMLGGEAGFGPGGWVRGPVAELLPVVSDFSRQEEEPALALIFVVDRSGSMTGEKLELAKDAVRAAIEVLSPRDYAGVVAFDAQAFWLVPVQALSDPQGFGQQVAGLRADGGTSIAPALELAAPALASTAASVRHVILLTDGQSTPGAFAEAVGRLTATGATVSTVALGADADQVLLQQIATWGAGRYHYAASAQQVPQIFARETQTVARTGLREVPFLPVATRRAAFLRGLDWTSAPYLQGYTLTRPRPTAEVWLATDRGEPLLATWRAGLGTVGAFTSDVRNRWATDWLRWEGFGPFWAQVSRYLLRTRSLRAVPVVVERLDDRSFRLRAETLDEQGEAVASAIVTATSLAADGRRREAQWQATAPGQWETVVAAPAEGREEAWEVVLRDRQGQPVGRRTIWLVGEYSAEYLPPLPATATAGAAEVRPSWLTAAGTVGHDWRQPLPPSRHRAVAEVPLWPWLLGLALALFLCDVALKRWPSRRPEGT